MRLEVSGSSTKFLIFDFNFDSISISTSTSSVTLSAVDVPYFYKRNADNAENTDFKVA